MARKNPEDTPERDAAAGQAAFAQHLHATAKASFSAAISATEAAFGAILAARDTVHGLEDYKELQDEIAVLNTVVGRLHSAAGGASNEFNALRAQLAAERGKAMQETAE